MLKHGRGTARLKANQPSTFDKLGIVPVVNASGIYTDLGGSVLSEAVWDALTGLNNDYVDLVDLLDRTGELISKLTKTEAARVTPSASAGIALAVAACIVAREPEKGEQLPNVDGLLGEVVLQQRQADSYKYLNPLRLPGAKVVLAGTSDGTRRAEFQRAISSRTGAVFVPVHLDSLAGCLTLEEVALIARERGVPVIVDAAYMCYPPEQMGTYARRGADITCFSAKYFGGPNAGGFVAGRRDLVEAIKGLEFTRHESGAYRRFGRAFKMGRYEIAAVALALEEWFGANHSRRLAGYVRRAEALATLIGRSKTYTLKLKCFTLDGRLVEAPVNAVVLKFVKGAQQTSADAVRKLAVGSPSIRTIDLDGSVVIVTETLKETELGLVARRVRNAARSGNGTTK